MADTRMRDLPCRAEFTESLGGNDAAAATVRKAPREPSNGPLYGDRSRRADLTDFFRGEDTRPISRARRRAERTARGRLNRKPPGPRLACSAEKRRPRRRVCAGGPCGSRRRQVMSDLSEAEILL